jgi:hypothetical protein
MAKASTQNALERFFPQVGKEAFHMSQQAFSAARQKIKWEAFEQLFQTSVSGSYEEECTNWRGFRVLVIDGSFIQLPSEPELLKYYGGLGKENTAASALASLMYDVENDIIVDARLEPISRDERSLAKEHLEELVKLESFQNGHQELLIFDRGYPSKELVKSLEDKHLRYVMRTPKGFIREELIGEQKNLWTELGKSGRRVRVIVIPLENGEREILITNLSEEEMEYEGFAELYHKRWGIETKYKTVKQKLEVENFSGRLVENIKQDFYAQLTAANMLASCIREAQREVKKQREKKANRYEYQVNVNHAVGVFKDKLIRVVIEEDNRVRGLMKQLVQEMERRVVPIREKRKVKRKQSSRKAKFHHNHKSNC